MTAEAQHNVKPDSEFQALVCSTHAGNPAALTALGLRLIAGRDAPWSPVDGEALIAEAARQGNAAAWYHLATLSAAGAVRQPCWSSAWEALCRAKTARHAPALRLCEVLSQAGLRSAADIEAWLSPPDFRTLHHEPRAAACRNFIDPAWCRHLMTLARPQLRPAMVYDFRQRSLRLDPMRTNRNAPLSVTDTDLIVQLIRARIALSTNVPASHLEPPEILHYAPGQQYRLHVDFFHPSVPHFAEIVREQGQRILTLLLYLNEDYTGGATDFPRLGMKFRGAPGEALLFENVNASGEGDMRTAHSGMPVTAGNKWLFSQWIRNRRQKIA